MATFAQLPVVWGTKYLSRFVAELLTLLPPCLGNLYNNAVYTCSLAAYPNKLSLGRCEVTANGSDW